MTGTKCRAICDLCSVKSSSYQDGKLKKCTVCEVFLKSSYERCPCCKLKLRCKPKATKDKRTREGDEALTFFDIAVIRANNEFKILKKCYKMPKLGHNIIDSIFRQLNQIIIQYEKIRENKRQRPDYLKAKYEMMEKLIAKTRKEIDVFNASILQ